MATKLRKDNPIEDNPIDKIFNRLRARLYNMLEQIGLDETQHKSYKQQIKDITASAWNDINNLDSKEN